MEQELNQLVQAILIASDPTPGPLHNQALEYLTRVQQNSSESWRLALALFADPGPDGGRKYPAPARFFALRVLEDFLDNRCVTSLLPLMHQPYRSAACAHRFEPLDNESFQVLRQGLVSYIQSEYLYGSAEANAACT